jgi:hypothetical protein
MLPAVSYGLGDVGQQQLSQEKPAISIQDLRSELGL